MSRQTSSMSNGSSGMRITSAPPASPECRAIQPAWRPITSTTRIRWWLSAVVCSRSIASVAICSAVSKPKVWSVAPRSLSIVLGTPITGTPAAWSLWAAPRVSSPPIAISPSSPRRSSVPRTAPTPSSRLSGLVRELPRIVPPRGRMPRVDSIVSSSPMSSRTPRHPSRKPMKPSSCASIPLRTTARITALRPGQSPPPVSRPSRIGPASYADAARGAGPWNRRAIRSGSAMSDRRRPPARRIARPALLATLAGGVAASALAERRHLRAIADDEEFRVLSAPLTGAAAGHAVLAVRSADGTVLHAERFGAADADATLVLAHGWTEAIPFWGPVIRRLASPDLALVAYDLRGHGESAAAQDGDYALERFGEDLEAVLAAVAAEPARTAVAGHSLGAMSIAAWAAAHDVQARIAAASMINTGLSNLIGGALVLGELGSRLAPEAVSRALLGSGRPMLPVSTPLSLALTRHIAFGPDASAGMIAFYERMLMRTDAGVRGAVGITLSGLDLSEATARITVPTQVIAGDSDRL